MNALSRVAVALSGGVDSAMAAVLLRTAGWQVHGLYLVLCDVGSEREGRVRELADRIAIPLEVKDLRRHFETRVIMPFCDAYLKGLTPSPCVVCNREIKFEALYRYCIENGIDWMATGHYVRLEAEKGRVRLLRGMDIQKDQSYFLQRVSPEHLARSLFPLGKMTKEEIRHRARDLDLPCHGRPESQEICFMSGADYRGFIEQRRGPGISSEGEIVTEEGGLLGTHRGAYRYTIGQRHGLGIASSEPYYVKEIRPELSRVVVARREALFSGTVDAIDVHWVGGSPPEDGVHILAQIRYRHRAAPGRLMLSAENEVRFLFDTPQWAVTPGQALALYVGERLIGGGWITRSAT